MAIRNIITYPDPLLIKETHEVEFLTPKIKQIIKDLTDTMYGLNALGIAAPQIGCPEKIFIVDIGKIKEDEKLGPLVFINPQITYYSSVKARQQEGCLSFPDIFVDIERSETINAEYKDGSLEKQTIKAKGLLARAIQHEFDHLDGKLMTDRVSAFKARQIRRKVKRQ